MLFGNTICLIGLWKNRSKLIGNFFLSFFERGGGEGREIQQNSISTLIFLIIKFYWESWKLNYVLWVIMIY